MPEGESSCAEQGYSKDSFAAFFLDLVGNQDASEKRLFQEGRKEEQGERQNVEELGIQNLAMEELAAEADSSSYASENACQQER